MSSWALEDFAEDAIVAYLTDKVEYKLMKFYPAWTDEKIEYPCAVVHAGTSQNAGEIIFNGIREVDITIAVMSEAAADGAISARERNRIARSAVMETLAQTALQDDVNALAPDGVIFSLAYIGKITRSVETERRVFVSEIELITICSPKELI